MPSHLPSERKNSPAATAAPVFNVAFFLVPGFSMMALSSAVEPLRSVNRMVGECRYDWHIVAKEKGPVSAGNKLEITAAHGLADSPCCDLTIVVASLDAEGYHEPKVFEWLRKRHEERGMLGAVSNGTLILARAGLLAGRRATIHWEMQRWLAEEFPAIKVRADLYCIDRDVMTAAGGIAAMDMMLAMIAERDGREIAADVSEQFLHGPVRASTERQRRDVRWRYDVTDRRLVTIIRLMEENLSDPIKISQVSDVAGVSERQMERLFESALGTSPSEFYLRIRLRVARARLLHSTESLEKISDFCGFSSPGHFSNAFKICYGEPPSIVRRRTQDEPSG